MTYEQYEVVVVPFPFTDKNTSKRRPAIVLSDNKIFNHETRQSVLAMITSAKNTGWPLDVEICDLDSAGLPSASMIRMKLFTLDHQLIIRKAGTLSLKDRKKLQDALSTLLNMN